MRLRRAPWLTGFLTDLSNPKAAIFWTTLFATLLPARRPFWLDAAAVGTVVVIAGAWYAILVVAFSANVVSTYYQRARRTFERVTGGIYVTLAGLLLVDR